MHQQEEKEIKKRRPRRRGPVLMLIGLALIAGVLAVQAMDYYNEKALLSTMEQLLAAEKRPSGDAIQRLPEGEEPVLQSEETLSQEPLGASLLGSLTIPCIGLEVPLVEGSDRNALRSAVGHMSGTALPGTERGNCVIAGHRNYSFGRFFNRLDEVRVDDEIEIAMVSGKSCTYRVSSISVVEPDEVSVLEPTREATLTLITCTPIYIASHRLIVKAELIKF